MLGVELAHHHHTLPVQDRHQDRAPSQLPELTKGLSCLVLLVGGKVARAQQEGAAAAAGGKELIELTLEPAALRRAIAQKYARLAGVSAFVPEAQVQGRQVGAQFEALDDNV